MTCVVCGREFERSRGRGRPAHACPDCRRGSVAECAYCGQLFLRATTGSTYCSRACHLASYRTPEYRLLGVRGRKP